METRNNNKMISRAFSYLIVASLLLIGSCSSKTKTEITDDETAGLNDGTYELTFNQFQSSGMELGKLEIKSFHQVVKANGMFDVPPENSAAVSCYFGGTVKDIRLLPGERVEKGEVLFILENPEYVQIQQDFLEAKGQLTYLKTDYERQKNLVQDNVTSQKTYLKAESDYIVTRVKVESLSKKLALMNINSDKLTLENMRTTISILSPLSGYVTDVAISRGSFLDPSTLAVSIVDTDHLHLELNIFEKDLNKVKIGQPIQFQIHDDWSNEYKATVHLVNKTVEAEKRTVGIHGHLIDEKLTNKFYPGMYVEADIYTSSFSRMALPQTALVEVESKYYVLVVQNTSDIGYTFIKREVQIGLSNDSYIEILNPQDFRDDAQFLVNGAYNLITE